MDSVVAVEGLKVHFPIQQGALSRLLPGGPRVVHAVDGVTLSIRRGEIYGLVGESGSGKTTLGRTMLRLLKPTEGKVLFEGSDITDLKEREVRPLRRKMQIVFQDPHAALNPAMTVGAAIADPLIIHERASKEEEAKPEVLRMMDEVGLNPPKEFYDKLPSALSGGQKQRVVIARAMILRPSFIVADEPVAMLDMSVRARILELLLELKQRHNLTYLFITHDLATAKFLCDRIAIMYLGKLMEEGEAAQVYADPKHPYTQALLGAIPIPDPERRATKPLPKGEIPDAIRPPASCRFHPRCLVATKECGWEPRDFLNYLEERRTHLAGEAAKEDVRVLGDLKHPRIDGQTLRIAVPRDDPASLKEYLGRILSEGRGPLFEAVDGIATQDSHVVVRFRPWTEFGEFHVGRRRILCILFKETGSVAVDEEGLVAEGQGGGSARDSEKP